MPTTARRRHRVDTGGPWGTALLLLGIGLIIQGAGYIAANRSGLPDAIQDISDPIPLWVWGSLWISAGTYSLWKALNPPQRHIDVWAAVAITSLWSSTYFITWVIQAVQGDFTRDFFSALGWGMLAGVIICLGSCSNPIVLDR